MGEDVKIGAYICHCGTTVEALAVTSPITRVDQKVLPEFLGCIAHKYLMR